MLFLKEVEGISSSDTSSIVSSVCGGSEILKVIYFIQKLLKIVSVLVPILLIVMISLDFMKNVIAGREDDMKKNLQIAIKRIIMAVGFFLVPTIVSFMATILGNLGVDYMLCITEATPSKIAAYEKEEEALKELQEQTNNTQNSVDLSGGSSLTPSENQNKGDTTTGSKTNVSFSKIDDCSNNKVITTVKGSNGQTAKIHTCIKKFNLNNINSVMQNFAITDKFVYFSHPGRGAWVKQESTYQKLGARAALKKTSAHYITRVNRSTNTFQRIYVEFAGHAQSFDVTNNNQIYMNYFAKLHKGTLGYGAQYVGVTNISFKSNTEEDGVEVVPTTAISVNSDGQSFSIFKSASYYENGKLNANSYYDKVVSIGSSSGKMTNPEVAVDEENNQIALVSGTKAYIYNLTDFNNGKATLLKNFTIDSGKQGVELYNGYLYLWTGNKTHVLYKYNISTGSLDNKISFNLYNYYGNGKGNEAEGISVYKGNVYIGVPGSKCNGKTCTDIFLVKGF